MVGAALFVLFRYPALQGTAAVAVAALAAAPAGWLGVRLWKAGARRVAVAHLLAFCLLLPLALLVAMGEWGLFAAATRGREDLELFSRLAWFKRVSNAQLWWALLLGLAGPLWLRRYTRSTVFSLATAAMAALLCLATLLRLGLIEWLDTDPGRPYFALLPCAALFLGLGMLLEHFRRQGDSKYFYPAGVFFTWAALSGVVTFHEPYANWLKSVAPWTRGQLEYLFIGNALVYFTLDRVCTALNSPQMRAVAKAFRFVTPGHVLTSLLLLGLSASELWRKTPADAALRFEARLFEVLLPLAACAFVLGSVPRQMKNFFATGLLFLAIGIVRLQQDLFEGRAAWPVALLAAGTLLMLAAARYAPLRMALARLWPRR